MSPDNRCLVVHVLQVHLVVAHPANALGPEIRSKKLILTSINDKKAKVKKCRKGNDVKDKNEQKKLNTISHCIENSQTQSVDQPSLFFLQIYEL